MGIAVYPRLGTLLAQQQLSVEQLTRQIEERFGLVVDQPALERLVRAEPVRTADLELAAAAAVVLGADLSDLFAIETTEVNGSADEQILDPERSRRLGQLLEQQDRRDLSADEQQELDDLVAEYGRRLDDRLLHRIATRRRIPVVEARHELEASLEQALAARRAVEADPQHRKTVQAAIKKRRKSASG